MLLPTYEPTASATDVELAATPGARSGAPEWFRADLARVNATLAAHGAITTTHDGTEHVTIVDPTVVLPAAVLRSYRFLLQFGAANGYL
jgi:hypothetical protein